VAVVGAGPVGLEMALALVDGGFDVRVYEAGRTGEQLSWFRDVALFTPFSMNSTEETRGRLRRAGVALPSDGALLTAGEFVDRYLAPIAALPELRGRIHEGCRVVSIARAGAVKSGARGGARGEAPFVLRVEENGSPRFIEADRVIDASGVVARPRSFGPGGLQARGEEALEGRIDRHLPSRREDLRARCAGKRALLVGNGHSAATALVELDALARTGAGPSRVHWVCRNARFVERLQDPLSARQELASQANFVAATATWLVRHSGSAIEAVETAADDSIDVMLVDPRASGVATRVRVDRILSLAGYRPDTDLYRELQVHTCYASEAPMALAAALASARAADPHAAGDCLTQTTHGPETLRTTEPGFFVVGAKSYGRNPDFLIRLGYEQVRDIITLLAPSPSRDPLEAPF
jgi:thioredoxin reductase